jgi:hypothetical protein
MNPLEEVRDLGRALAIAAEGGESAGVDWRALVAESIDAGNVARWAKYFAQSQAVVDVDCESVARPEKARARAAAWKNPGVSLSSASYSR